MENACYLKDVELFRNLPEDALQELLKLAVARRFKNKQLAFTPEESREKVYIVKEGELVMYQPTAQGKRVVLDVLKAGDVLGDVAYGEQIPKKSFAETKTETLLCVLTREDFLNVLRRYPEAALKLITELQRKLAEAESRIRDLAALPAEERLLNALVRFARRHGWEEHDRFVLEDKISHQQLAQMVGIARETVTKILASLRRRGSIGYTLDRKIILYKKK